MRFFLLSSLIFLALGSNFLIAQNVTTHCTFVAKTAYESFDDGIYGDNLRAYFQFTNNYNKTINAIGFRFYLRDAFGTLLVQGDGQFDERISPNSTNPKNTFFYWDKSGPGGTAGYDRGESYNKLLGPIRGGTIQYTVIIDRIAFSDGTVMRF